MDGWKQWSGPDELLELFGIDPERRWAGVWAGMVVTLAAGMVHPDYGIDIELICRAWLRDEKVSPVVFWSQIKRELAPLLAADLDTLESLGLRPYDRTGKGLLRAAAVAMVDDGWTAEESTVRHLARLLRGLSSLGED